MLRTIAALVSVAIISACSSGPPRTPTRVLDRALASAGTTGLAQPGQIVATESAFARAARESGQWAAFRSFAAPGAQWHGLEGPVAAEAWLRARANPAATMRWAPRDVWMSCDATLAVSQGRFKDGNGMTGTYATVWHKQGDGAYRWAYHTHAHDVPQPPPSASPSDDGDEIVVLAMERIKGTVADCAGRPADPGPNTNPDPVAKGTARDGTLHWLAQQRGDGIRRFIVLINKAGEWEEALDIGFNPG